MIEILSKKTINSYISEDIQKLFRQLSPNKVQIPIKDLLSETNDSLIFACYTLNKKIVGIASLCSYKVISGHKGWIEDVVVDLDYRGQGIGEKLIQKLISTGKEKGLTEIYLFTENEKKAAIRLYLKLGFKQRNSKLYNLKLT
ncbi:GNAT family N-acetyltransferase [Aquimarina algiphila]|uniref:GNAT family N-acetyltransferase n=1 Tax=Aquimarina algiphila TaxID=2047982 RepID=UPI00232BE70C|nr:GNAT family N-acetyltransferase [Aquimarina algiphila]